MYSHSILIRLIVSIFSFTMQCNQIEIKYALDFTIFKNMFLMEICIECHAWNFEWNEKACLGYFDEICLKRQESGNSHNILRQEIVLHMGNCVPKPYFHFQYRAYW